MEKMSMRKEKVAETSLAIGFSSMSEVRRIKDTMKNLDWFREQGYEVNLPPSVAASLKEGKMVKGEALREIVQNEFDADEYKRRSDELEERWQSVKDRFLADLFQLGLPVPQEFQLTLTKYGVGGSYSPPNKIILNFDYHVTDILSTSLHEMIHLVIEGSVQKNKIEHWTKERLVDLTYGRFFPGKNFLQREPRHSADIQRIFDRYFPDMKKVTREIGRLK